jgi:hypothetical protein
MALCRPPTVIWNPPTVSREATDGPSDPADGLLEATDGLSHPADGLL